MSHHHTPDTMAAADQAMRDASLDLDETIERVREFAAGHDPADVFLTLLGNFKGHLETGRPELVAATTAIAVMRLADQPTVERTQA